MASVNKVILIGNLGRDPEKRQTPSGATVCNITVATSRQWKDRNTGDRQEETEWHRVVLYDRLGDIAAEYLRKGRSVYIEGRLKTRKWTDKDGADRYTTEIIAEQMQMLGGRDGGEGGSGSYGGGAASGGYGGGSSYGNAPAARGGAAAAQQPPAAKAPAAGGTGFDDMDDDIPF